MKIALGVVAHRARAEQAHQLQESTNAHYMHMDNGGVGCHAAHRKAWSYLSGKDTDYSVVLEDDCAPVDGFREQLEEALAVSPAPIVSLYLGRSRPAAWQSRIQQAANKSAEVDACWIVGKHLLHAVGVAIRTDLLAGVKLDNRLPIDQAWSKWLRGEHLSVAYTWPSLVEHRDGKPLVEHPEHARSDGPRTAWSVGTRESWNDQSVRL